MANIPEVMTSEDLKKIGKEFEKNLKEHPGESFEHLFGRTVTEREIYVRHDGIIKRKMTELYNGITEKIQPKDKVLELDKKINKAIFDRERLVEDRELQKAMRKSMKKEQTQTSKKGKERD